LFKTTNSYKHISHTEASKISHKHISPAGAQLWIFRARDPLHQKRHASTLYKNIWPWNTVCQILYWSHCYEVDQPHYHSGGEAPWYVFWLSLIAFKETLCLLEMTLWKSALFFFCCKRAGVKTPKIPHIFDPALHPSYIFTFIILYLRI